MQLLGRRKIFTDHTEITEANIVEVLSDALGVHAVNASEIQYLRRYVRGMQPIRNRKKKVRKDVNNKVVVNIAQECLDFRLGFSWGTPIAISRRSGCNANNGVELFNGYMEEQGKDDVDQDLANDFLIGGLAYRAVLPNPVSFEESPFKLAKLDAETTFCVYTNDVFKRKVLGVSFCQHRDGTTTYTAYTNSQRFEILAGPTGMKLIEASYNGLGCIPIAVYEAPDLSGCYERSLPLLDAINVLSSNRLDDIEQFVASILWIHNADMSDDDLARLDELLAVRTNSSGDGQQAVLKYLSTPLDQTSVETLEQSMENHVYELCGVPGRVQSSGGSTGAAAELGEAGWKKIDYIAKRHENAWKRGERETLSIALAILDRSTSLPTEVSALKLVDFEISFVRSKNYNVLTKTQGMLNMLQAGVHPRIAYRESELFPDPEQVYQDSIPYIEKAMERMNGVSRETGDITNQPKGEKSMTQAVQNQAIVQKRD